MAENIEVEEWLLVTKGNGFPNARIPEDLDATNSFTNISSYLVDKARAIDDIHRQVNTGGAKPLTTSDYAKLADNHDSLAKTHQNTALRLQAADPVKYIQAISAHGDAMGSHEDAASIARMMTGVHNVYWDTLHNATITPLEVWRDAHRAFLLSQMAFDRTNFATGIQKSDTEIRKGDVMGHVFHGNQYKGGTSTIPDGVGGRDFSARQTLGQISRDTILSVSGGRVNTIHDASGRKTIGIELPVSNGYKVRVYLHDSDTYTVQRVWRDTVKGEMSNVYADDLNERVYQAGMFRSDAFGGHKP